MGRDRGEKYVRERKGTTDGIANRTPIAVVVVTVIVIVIVV